MADDRLVQDLQERVSRLSAQVVERERWLDELRVRSAGSDRLARDAADAIHAKDRAVTGERKAKQEAAEALQRAREAEREAARLRTQLEDERAFTDGVRDKLARLDALEERVKAARTLGDLIPD